MSILFASDYTKDELNVLLQDSDVKPYSEVADGGVLSTINKAIKGTLFKTGTDYEILPGIIKNWTWNHKDNSYIFTIDPQIMFTDGTEPNAEDLEFSLVRGFYSEKRNFYEIYLNNILGVDKIEKGKKYKPWQVSGISKIDKKTVKVILLKPNPSFLYSLTRPYFSLTSIRYYNDDLVTFKKFPVGAGNYRIVSEDSQKVVLETINKKSKIKKINLLIKNNEKTKYDITFLNPRNEKEKIFITDKADSILALFLNKMNDLSNNENFRKSIFYGIDRKSILNEIKTSSPSYSFLSGNYWLRSEINDQFDLQKAKTYFNKIEKKYIKHYKIPVFSMSGVFSERMKLITQRLTDQLKAIGYDMTFFPSKDKFLSKEVTQESPFSVTARVSDNLDPLLMFASFRTESAYKWSQGQNDSIFDALYEKASIAASSEDRVKTMGELSKYTLDHHFMIPISENKNVYYYDPSTIKSLGEQHEALTLDFDQIELK